VIDLVGSDLSAGMAAVEEALEDAAPPGLLG
jgi:hypothetical protein